MRIIQGQEREGIRRFVKTLKLVSEELPDDTTLGNLVRALNRREVQGNVTPLSEYLAMEERADLEGQKETEDRKIEETES